MGSVLANKDFLPASFHELLSESREESGLTFPGLPSYGRRISDRILAHAPNVLEVSNVLATKVFACHGALVGPLDLRLFEQSMKFSTLATVASLSCLLASCTGTTTVKPVEKPPVTSSKNAAHKAVAEPTQANAGAAKCTIQNGQHIGALAKDGGFAIGFGEQGGLAAWSSPEGMRVKTLSLAGTSEGSSTAISFPKGAQPVEIAPVARGYAIIAKRIESTVGPCEATCGDKPCPPGKPEAAPAQTCEKPTGHQFFVQLTDIDGKNPSAGRPFNTGLVDIETILLGDGRAFGVLTKNEVVWIQKRPDDRLDAERVEFPAGQLIVPVHGFGPPAVVVVDKDGSMQLLDERGIHEIQGKFAGPPGKAAPAPAPAPAPKAGTNPGGKPAAPAPAAPAVKPGPEMIFRVQWGPKGRLEVARRIGEVAQYATIEKLELHMLNDSESQEIRESFAKALDVRMESGKLRRTTWDKKPLGDDINVHDADPTGTIARVRTVWTGSVFVFAQPSIPTQHPDATAVGILVANCTSAKP